jgi:hypothetical protein
MVSDILASFAAAYKGESLQASEGCRRVKIVKLSVTKS